MEAPFIGLQIQVPSEWIDINGHMNATHYGLAVYDTHVNFTEAIGLGEAYVKKNSCGKAVLESHMVYEREVSLGDKLEIKSWLLAVDRKKLHFFHEVYNVSKGFRAATSEQVDIHIDLNKRASAPLPSELHDRLQKIVELHLSVVQPQGIDSQIRPPKRI